MSTCRRIMWVFAGLFLLFGIPLIFLKEQAPGVFLAGLSAMSLGGFALFLACDAVQCGELKLQHAHIFQKKQPRLFCFAVLFIALCGLGLIVATWMMIVEKG